MSIFPETPRELIRSLGELDKEADDDHWAKFVELYEPAIRAFIRLQDSDVPPADCDDLVQETLVRLVPIIRNRTFDPEKGHFRNLVTVIVRRLMIDRLRRLAVRQGKGTVPLDDVELAAPTLAADALVDMKWRLACHHAAIEQVFAHSALSEQSRKIYLMSEAEGLAMKEIAHRLGLAPNAVRRIASRVRKMIAAVEGVYGAC